MKYVRNLQNLGNEHSGISNAKFSSQNQGELGWGYDVGLDKKLTENKSVKNEHTLCLTVSTGSQDVQLSGREQDAMPPNK